MLIENTTGNEKQVKKKRKITKTQEKKEDNARSSLVQHNLFKVDSSSFEGVRDSTGVFFPR